MSNLKYTIIKKIPEHAVLYVRYESNNPRHVPLVTPVYYDHAMLASFATAEERQRYINRVIVLSTPKNEWEKHENAHSLADIELNQTVEFGDIDIQIEEEMIAQENASGCTDCGLNGAADQEVTL